MSKKEKVKDFIPISKLFPNVVTLLSLCAGLSAVRYAMFDEFHKSII